MDDRGDDMKFLAAAALVAVAMTGGAGMAEAHGPMAAAYGGQIVETNDGWRIEFAIRDGGIRVWVRDHADAPVAATGKATLLAGGRKLETALKAEGEVLAAEAAVTAADKVAAILTLTVAGKPVSVRFGQDALVVPPLSAKAQAGRQAFEQICAACHDTTLRGSDAGPPLLHPFYAPGAGHGDDVIVSAITKGAKAHHWKFGDMPKPEGVAPGGEADILAYIRAMQAANGLGGGAPAPGAASGHAGH
jgi:mono/diheme cytochrome c family protein